MQGYTRLRLFRRPSHGNPDAQRYSPHIHYLYSAACVQSKLGKWRKDVEDVDYDDMDWEGADDEEEEKKPTDFDNKEVREAYVRTHFSCIDKRAFLPLSGLSLS